MKNLEITNIFSTPISIIDLDKEQQDLMDKEIGKIINEVEFFPMVYPWRTANYINIPERTTEFLFDKYEMIDVKNMILGYVNNYVQSLTGKSILELKLHTACMYSWLTKSHLHNYFAAHHHSHVGVSGVYYYKILPGGSNLYFKSIDKATEVSPVYKFSRRDKYEIEVKPGRMVLFPGWLEHGTSARNDPEDRISLGFDIILREEDRGYRR
jgi:hypothetical protein